MNELYTVSRPHNDFLTFPLVRQLVAQLHEDCEAYYLWTADKTFDKFLSLAKFTKPLVIIAIKDIMVGAGDFDWWTQTQQQGITALVAIIERHPDQHFVIFSSYESLERELNHPRVTLIPFGGDIVNQHTAYTDCEPVIDKKLDGATHVMCLNRNRRDHRIVTLSYLYGLGIDRYIHKTFLYIRELAWNQTFLERISWQFSQHHSRQRHKIINGYKKLINDKTLLNKSGNIYPNADNDNRGNFERELTKLYQSHVVEIVNETTCSPPAYMLTEKTLHSYYGSVFPIFISGQASVAHQRELGFDVFDDVVDHSYDLIADPMDRVISAIDQNIKLLTDRQYAIEKWHQCRARFMANAVVAKGIYAWYEQRTRQKWQYFCQNRLQE